MSLDIHMYKKAKMEVDKVVNCSNPGDWVNKYADYLFAYAINRIDNHEQARDLVQETFLAGLESMKNFEGRSTEKTWLTSILRNKIFDIYRAKGTGLKSIPLSEANPQFFNQDDGHWKIECRPMEFFVQEKDQIESKEFNQILQECMKKLPALWFAAFKLKFLEDENADDICQKLSVTPSNYWVIIHRAKLNLRSCLQKHWL